MVVLPCGREYIAKYHDAIKFCNTFKFVGGGAAVFVLNL
jgi:hypothetical protein